MFADSLLEGSWAHRSRRGWSTLISFGAQAFALAILLTLPLYYTGVLPRMQTTAPLSVPPARPSVEVFHAAPSPPAAARRDSDVTMDGHLAMPPTIPDHIAQIVESSAPLPAQDPGTAAVTKFQAAWGIPWKPQHLRPRRLRDRHASRT